MCRAFIAACQNNLKLSFNLYKKSVQYWAALHGKDSEKLIGLKTDLAKIRSKGIKPGAKDDDHAADESDDHLSTSPPTDLSPPSSSSSSSSSTSESSSESSSASS